jgi:hypothetical protein
MELGKILHVPVLLNLKEICLNHFTENIFIRFLRHKEIFKKCLCIFQTQNKIHIMKSVLYGTHKIGDMMFKGSNFYSVWKNQNHLCPHLVASASFEVCSMLS